MVCSVVDSDLLVLLQRTAACYKLKHAAASYKVQPRGVFKRSGRASYGAVASFSQKTRSVFETCGRNFQSVTRDSATVATVVL